MKRILASLLIVLALGGIAATANRSGPIVELQRQIDELEADVLRLCRVTYGVNAEVTNPGPVSDDLLACLVLFAP